MKTRTEYDRKETCRKVALANPGWPVLFVRGFVDGMLDGLDGRGPRRGLPDRDDMDRKGYRVAYKWYNVHKDKPAPMDCFSTIGEDKPC